MKTTNTDLGIVNSSNSIVLPATKSNARREVKTTAAVVANSVHLPSLPDVASQFLDLAQQEDPDFREMARVIRLDPAVAGKLLTTANSALFGFRTKVESVESAIPKLGTSVVRTLILGFHLGTFRPNGELVAAMFPKLWQNFLTQAVIAESVAEQTHLDEAKCFLAGMIQDVGVLALVSEYPEEYTDHVLKKSRLPNVIEAERSYFGFSHIDVSVEIIKKWNIGGEFLDAVTHHHDRFVEPTSEGLSQTPMHAVLQAANMGAGCLLSGAGRILPDSNQIDEWHSFLAEHFGYEPEESVEILKDVGHRVQESSVVFGVDAGKRIDSAQIASVATSLLQEIALSKSREGEGK
jgi:HD-like signal output (HDOD) protein